MMKRLRRRITYVLTVTMLLSIVLGLMLTGGARRVRAATTRTVTVTSDSGAGSLRQAIADSAAGDSINFASNVTGTITLTSGELVIGVNLTITGPGASVLSVSGNNASRVLNIAGGTATIAGLTITAGNVSLGDGGNVINQSALTLSNCTISHGSALGNGGGICNNGGCTLSGCTVSNNVGISGGGIFNTATMTVQSSTLSNNLGQGGGGGIFNTDALTITDSTISGNTSPGGFGGGVCGEGNTATLTNCTITANSASGASGLGGGVFSGDAADALNNTIVAGNFSGSGPIPNDIFLGGAGRLVGDHCLIGDAGSSGGITNGTSGNIVGVNGSGTLAIDTILNPILADYGGPTETHLLVCSSPAIDAGENSLATAALLTTDQRGAPRVAGAAVDIGAVEMQSQVSNTNDGGAGSLRQAISSASSGSIIDFAPCLTGTITLTSGTLNIDESLTINGPGANLLTVSGNNALQVFLIGGGTVAISGLDIEHGSASNGGGLQNDATLTLSNCTIANNSASVGGGGISNGGILTIFNSTIANNSASDGGGGIIGSDAPDSTTTLTNCTIANNTTPGDLGGGGIQSPTVTLSNCTVANNSAPDVGGGINARSVVLTNTIIANNTGAGGGDVAFASATSLGHNLIGNTGSTSGWVASDLLNVGPVLDPTGLKNNGGPTQTIALEPGSPAIDGASSTDALGNTVAIDQRGVARPTDGNGGGTALNDIGAYQVAACTVTTLTISTPPQPQTVCAGGTATFTAATTGGGAGITPQWKVSTDHGATFTNIAGATTTTLTVPGVTASQSGNQYMAVFSNLCATTTTSAATLTVNTVPSVTTNPISHTACAGTTVTFTTAASGSPVPSVQWQVSTGGSFTNIAGATGATLSLNNVTASQNGNQYQAVFSNAGCSSATSSPATLTVNSAAVVTTNPVSQSVAAASVTFTAAATGSPAPTVQWQVSTNAGVTFTNIPGATSTTLTFAPTPSQSGNEYRAVFTDSCGTATTTAATLTYYDTCIQDNTSKNVVQLDTTTGQYRFTRCSDGLTFAGKGQLVNQSGVLKLTDHQAGWVISATFNPGQRTGNAVIQLIIAPGLSETITISDTNPANTCGCGG
jgi:hypothetical protein